MRFLALVIFVGCHPSVFGYASAFCDLDDAIAGLAVNKDLGHQVSVFLTAYIGCSLWLIIKPFPRFFHEHRSGIVGRYFCFCPNAQPCTTSAHIFPGDSQSGFGTLCKKSHSIIKSTLLQLVKWVLRCRRRPFKRQQFLISWNSRMKPFSRGSHCFAHYNKGTSICRLLRFSLADRSTRSRC